MLTMTGRRGCRVRVRLFQPLLAFFLTAIALQAAERELALEEMLEMPLEELLQVRITTASKIPELSEAAPATVYVITEAHIRRLGLRDLKDILELVPGVDVIDPHFFVLGGQRGFVGTFAKTLLLINGREMNNLIAGETFISNQFRSGNIKQVEIINGPGSALYGANAMAGVINVITKTAVDFEGVEASASYGSWDTREVHALFGKTNDAFRISGSVTHFASDKDDFAGFLSDTAVASPLAENNPYRFRPDAFGYTSEADALWLSLQVENKGAYAGSEYYRNVTGRGTSGIQWDYTQGEDHRELWMTYLGYRWKGLRDGTLDVKAEYRYYWEEFWGNHTESEGPLENPFSGKVTTFDTTPGDVEAFRGFYSNKRSDGSQKHVLNPEATYRLNDQHTLVGGFNVEYSDIIGANFSRTNGVHPPITPAQRRPEFDNYKWGVYLQDRARFFGGKLTVTLGARYDDHELYGDSFNPRCGLVFQPVQRSIFKLLYGEAFREPNVFELQNNTEIKPTTMRTVEGGWHQYLGKNLKNEAVVFYNKAEDLIVSDSTELGGISNKGELDARGFEDTASFSLGKVQGFANYTYTTSELDEPEVGRHPVYDIPRHKVNVAGMVDVTDHCSVGLVARFRGDVKTEYKGRLFEIDDYVVFDLTLNLLRLPWFDADARLDVIAKNLFDEEAFHPEPRAPSVVEHPQDGRGVFVKLTVRI